MSKELKLELWRIGLSVILFVLALLLPGGAVGKAAAFLICCLVAGGDVLIKAVRNIFHGEIFDENFLMALAAVGAFVIGEYSEAAAVLLFYQVGEWFQSFAAGKSRTSISALMDIRPEYANAEQNGTTVRVLPGQLKVGDLIRIFPGERIPVDGVVLDGISSLDTSALTGESVPREIYPGDDVVSGCINQTGVLRVKVTRLFQDSAVSKILDLVEKSSDKKAHAENFITRFAKYYTPAVVCAAVLIAIVPSLITGTWSLWIHRALIFLVVSCPCALVLSVPLSFFGGIGGASRHGILVKGGQYMERLANAETVVFDKTGTLTLGIFKVSAVHPEICSRQELLEFAALAENGSNHPIAVSLRDAFGGELDLKRVQKTEEFAGRGIRAVIDGKNVYVGNSRWMEESGFAWQSCHKVGTTVHVAVDGSYAGHIVISDALKPDALEAVNHLKNMGIRRIAMLTGDNKEMGEHVASQLGIKDVYTQLLPTDKVALVEKMLAQKHGKDTLAFVGDGMNDAPVLARADIGIAMGGMGSDAAIEAADVVLMDDRPSRIADAISIARKTMWIVKENIIFALVVKGLILLLGAFGIVNMWAAVFADVGVSVLAVFNAMRTLHTIPKQKKL
ncbi:heavy metal translocating P-type ATPase [Ructibacterium gallinarum]|uniref:Cd(2+)-exporting ATPase n=1 Tax=Ructibacterium gallinarum TaxID=2779355 RepID=A0A9D5M2A7_9FIRM|nr:heavy metal translocating P-type ATPase [Ructibacterium gallinarum]MBE5039305.1 cadmium-translocating P-type ATPase [Ructibacterium gallinarum]